MSVLPRWFELWSKPLPAGRSVANLAAMTLAIEVHKVDVRLHTLGGETHRASLFLHACRAREAHPETVGDRLNDRSTEFLPCEIGENVQLLRLASLAYVEMDEPPPEVQEMTEVGAHRETVELHLVSGDVLHGELFCEDQYGSCRVSDLLNTETVFLLLDGDDRVCYVRRQAIDRVAQKG